MKYWVVNAQNKVIKTFTSKEKIDAEEILRNYPEGYIVMKSYCCCFADVFFGEYVGLCCKKHDNNVGQAGTYNIVMPHITFFKCLLKHKIPLQWAIPATLSATVGVWLMQPYFWYKIYRYRKKRGGCE
ncbi:hypothetical protein [Sulfurimonas sp.]|uniref:hypothetical protein n=1 Tax=Sulfurimonas sp. TaxID=2022749 RepID=UPI003D137995